MFYRVNELILTKDGRCCQGAIKKLFSQKEEAVEAIEDSRWCNDVLSAWVTLDRQVVWHKCYVDGLGQLMRPIGHVETPRATDSLKIEEGM